jgi:hypothetical protein
LGCEVQNDNSSQPKSDTFDFRSDLLFQNAEHSHLFKP